MSNFDQKIINFDYEKILMMKIITYQMLINIFMIY